MSWTNKNTVMVVEPATNSKYQIWIKSKFEQIYNLSLSITTILLDTIQYIF